MFRSVSLTRHVLRGGQRCCLTYQRENAVKFSSESEKEYEDVLRSIKKPSKVNKEYPKFATADSDLSTKPDLEELLESLRNSSDKDRASLQHTKSSGVKSMDSSSQKIGPINDRLPAHSRTEALFKHANANLHSNKSFNKGVSSSVENEQNAPSSNQMKKKDAVMKDQSKMKRDITPDESEVGNLLKALMENKISDQNVKDIMANVRSGSSVGRVHNDVRTALRGGAMMRLSEKETLRKSDQLFIREKRKKDKVAMKKTERIGHLFLGPRTHYFDDAKKESMTEDKDRFISIHEVKWRESLENQLRDYGPSNAFEELILKADKMWNFPIDNEAGLDEEEESNFEDHVFLDDHLSLFPEQGQIRRFMELVVTGLQQNPYINLKQKIDTIFWFKGYFEKFSDDDLEL